MMELKLAEIDDLKQLNKEDRWGYLQIRKEWLKKVRKEDKEEYWKEYNKIYAFLNKGRYRERTRLYIKRYREKHKEQIAKQVKEYHQTPKFKEYQRKYQREHKEQINARVRKRYWRKKDEKDL